FAACSISFRCLSIMAFLILSNECSGPKMFLAWINPARTIRDIGTSQRNFVTIPHPTLPCKERSKIHHPSLHSRAGSATETRRKSKALATNAHESTFCYKQNAMPPIFAYCFRTNVSLRSWQILLDLIVGYFRAVSVRYDDLRIQCFLVARKWNSSLTKLV